MWFYFKVMVPNDMKKWNCKRKRRMDWGRACGMRQDDAGSAPNVWGRFQPWVVMIIQPTEAEKSGNAELEQKVTATFRNSSFFKDGRHWGLMRKPHILVGTAHFLTSGDFCLSPRLVAFPLWRDSASYAPSLHLLACTMGCFVLFF